MPCSAWWGVRRGGQLLSRTRHSSRGSENHVRDLNLDHRFLFSFQLYDEIAEKIEVSNVWRIIAFEIGPHRWVPPMGPVQQALLSMHVEGQHYWQAANLCAGTWICCFSVSLTIVVRSKGVRRPLPVFLVLTTFSSAVFGGRLSSPILLGLTFTRFHGTSYVHCCNPATVMNHRSGYILIKGQEYLALSRPPMIIDAPNVRETDTETQNKEGSQEVSRLIL